MIAVYILLALVVFGFMIFIHELGHFMFAKKFGVTTSEFSIGMGPKILSKKGKDNILYSLRLFPIGGYVSMEGENEDSEDPNAFNKKPAWQRFIIVIAGALMNLIVGIVIMTIITIATPEFKGTTIDYFGEEAISDEYLMEGDTILKVGSTRVHTYDELSYEILRSGYEPVSLTVVRDGNEFIIDNVVFPTFSSDNVVFGRMDFNTEVEEKSFSTVVKNTFYSTKSTIKMIWDSLYDLITGRYGFEQVSGPIGVTGAISQAASLGTEAFFYMVVVISMNLGIFNLLPIPALDGGTLVFLIIEMIARKPIPRKIEDTIKFIGFALLMLLIIIVSFKDVIYLFK